MELLDEPRKTDISIEMSTLEMVILRALVDWNPPSCEGVIVNPLLKDVSWEVSSSWDGAK